jgi:peptide/nickel transport system ATP-binding protein
MSEAIESAELGPVVLRVENLKKYYELRDNSLRALIRGERFRTVKANEKLDFEAREAETLAIVGESGCGKSTLAKVLLGLETATEGSALLDNQDLGHIPVQKRQPQVVSHLQMVFQNPFDTLNPSHTVGSQISRVIRKFGVEDSAEQVVERVMKLLDIVKLPPDFYYRRPRQLSGGQKQRVGIARAFAGNPRVVVADEPVSALDVSVQAAVSQLLMEIQRDNRTTLLFISHDLSLVRYLADRVVVMYLGTIAEQGSTDEVFAPPYHPYTEALLSAIPIADTSVKKKEIVLEGDIPSAVNPPPGCPFQTRCPRKIGAICEQQEPPIRIFGTGHRIACHIEPDELLRTEPVITMGAKQAAE